MIIEKESSYINPLVIIKDSPIHGKGMFAQENIKKSAIIFRWEGIFISKDELKKFDAQKFILIQVDDDLWSVEPRNTREDDTYFINHSCDPNVWMKDGITFIARRDIKKGEELTIDYALFEDEKYVSSWNCTCGSSLCRHTITGKDYLLSELQKRYKNHFSPVINKKIK